MFFASKNELIQHLKGTVGLDNGGIKVENPDRLRTHAIDILVKN